MLVRAKMGVLDSICQQVNAESMVVTIWKKPDWDDDIWVTMLYTAIKDKQFPTELLRGFAQSASLNLRNFRTDKFTTLAVMEDVCTRLSLRLRQKFGVFVEVQ
jgi:hypothetical protein